MEELLSLVEDNQDNNDDMIDDIVADGYFDVHDDLFEAFGSDIFGDDD